MRQLDYDPRAAEYARRSAYLQAQRSAMLNREVNRRALSSLVWGTLATVVGIAGVVGECYYVLSILR